MLDQYSPNWVTGVSSPWINDYQIIQKIRRDDGTVEVDLKFDTTTSSGYWDSYFARLVIKKEDGFWRIDDITADKNLNIYMGNYAP